MILQTSNIIVYLEQWRTAPQGPVPHFNGNISDLSRSLTLSRTDQYPTLDRVYRGRLDLRVHRSVPHVCNGGGYHNVWITNTSDDVQFSVDWWPANCIAMMVTFGTLSRYFFDAHCKGTYGEWGGVHLSSDWKPGCSPLLPSKYQDTKRHRGCMWRIVTLQWRYVLSNLWARNVSL